MNKKVKGGGTTKLKCLKRYKTVKGWGYLFLGLVEQVVDYVLELHSDC